MSELKQIPEQIEIGKRVNDAFEKGKKFIIIDAPTGWGKTGLAYQIWNQSNFRTLILNNNNVLVNQYIDLIENNVDDCISCKGKTNYVCKRNSSMTPASSGCKGKACSLARSNACEYYKRRNLMDEKSLCISNYQLIFSLIDAGSDFNSYELTICDECHNLENILVDFATVLMSKQIYEELKDYSDLLKKAKFLSNEEKEEIKYNIEQTKPIIEKTNETNYSEMFKEYYKCIQRIYDIMDQESGAIDDDDHGFKNYVSNLINKWTLFIADCGKSMYIYESEEQETHRLVPLKIDNIFKMYMNRVSPRFVLMSATVINYKNLIQDLGIEENDVEYIELESKFPKENRPIIPLRVANVKITDKDYEKSEDFKVLIDTIVGLLNEHARQNQSGLIYCNSYKLCNMIYKNIINKVNFRILMNTNARDSKIILNQFLDTSIPRRLLISPSFAEGVNFNDDISRFQIIPKVPYLYLGSKRIATKCRMNPRWYTNKTIENIIQVTGRSVRSKEDEAVTYILDNSFMRCYNQYFGDYPKWFDEAIIKEGL